jgi:hypothetical protein
MPRPQPCLSLWKRHPHLTQSNDRVAFGSSISTQCGLWQQHFHAMFPALFYYALHIQKGWASPMPFPNDKSFHFYFGSHRAYAADFQQDHVSHLGLASLTSNPDQPRAFGHLLTWLKGLRREVLRYRADMYLTKHVHSVL